MAQQLFTLEDAHAILQAVNSQPVHDNLQGQRYNPPYSIENLSEEEFDEMTRRGNGEGSVFYNENRQLWQVALSLGYKPDGKRNRKILSTQTEAEAWMVYNQFMGNGIALPPETATGNYLTLEKCYNQYLESIEGQGSDRAFAGKIKLSKSIIADIGNNKMSELTEDSLRRYLNGWTSRTYTRAGKTSLYSQQHISKVYVNLKCVIKYAKKQGIISDNLLEDVKKPESKKFDEDTEKALTDAEVKKILQALSNKPMLKTMVMVMLYSGARPGEAAAMRFSDFDFEKKTVSFKRALSKTEKADIETKATSKAEPLIKHLKNERGTKKEYARRVLSVSDKVLDAVKEWQTLMIQNEKLVEMMKANGTDGYMFVKPKDGKHGLPDYYLFEYKKELKRNGLDGGVYRLYRFRHTFCTRLFKVHKLDPKTVQLMMGDNSMDMVMRVYNSINKQDLILASEKFSKSMDKVLGPK